VSPLASSKGTSNGPDWQDVTQAILNYELWQGSQIKILIEARPGKKTGDLIVTAEAMGVAPSYQGQLPSASVSVSCRSAGYLELSATILKALYDLDLACVAWDSYVMTNEST
jgi:hypothetical protein